MIRAEILKWELTLTFGFLDQENTQHSTKRDDT